VLAGFRDKFFGDCFGVASVWVIGENEGEDVSLVMEYVINEAGFGFGVFDVTISDIICKAFGVVEGDSAGEFVFEFVVESVLSFVRLEAVMFLALGEKDEVAWIAEVQSGAAVASQGVVVGFGDCDAFVEHVEVVVDGSPVNADLLAELSILEFVTGIGGSDGTESVEVFGLLDRSVFGEFFVEEEEEVRFCEVVPD